jgi:hypothetical protein
MSSQFWVLDEEKCIHVVVVEGDWINANLCREVFQEWPPRKFRIRCEKAIKNWSLVVAASC